MVRLKALFLCVLAFLVIKCLGESCKVGDGYSNQNRQSNMNIGGKWYLNTAVPATCSGRINSYRIGYHDNTIDEDIRYDIRVAIWKPQSINSTVWQKDENSVQYELYRDLEDDKRRKKRTLRLELSISFTDIGVRKGSIIGVYLDNSNPLTVIGRDSTPPSEPPYIGACITFGSQNTALINCTTDLFQSTTILHAESTITIVNCGTPPDHPNTNNTLVDGDTEFGARVEYNCNIGYNATSGNNLITCQLNGNWSDPTLTCQLVDCGTPGFPPNGQLIGNVFTYGASVQISCIAGHNLIGNDTLSCQANGQWNDTLPNCAPVNCGDPGTLTNGMIGGSAYTYSSVITFSCNTGYNLIGNVSSFCQANGQWNATLPVCSLINCGYPGNITNGVMMGANYTYSSIVTFTCNEGYILQGTNSLMCLNGWSDTLPSCSPVDCGDPGTPINGRSQGTNYTYQSIITFSCVNDDYTFVGNTAITCNADGHWNGSLPSCVYGECNDPGTPDNGQRIGSNFSYGASVSFSCNTGYELMGSSSILTCDVGNKWDFDPPVCNIIYCNAPGAPANGSISPLQANFTFNSTVQYQCNIGYEVIGHDTTTCGPDRTWTNGVPVCNMVVCPALTLPNGNIEGSNSYSSTITFHCNDSYQLSGNSSAVCQLDKTWSTDFPNCLKLCANDTLSSPLINGYQSPITGPYVEEDVVQYHCNAGYVLQGTPMVTCLATGHWSPIQEMPQCLLSTVSTTSSTIMTSSVTMASSVIPTSSRSLSQSSSRTTSLTMSNTIQRSSSSLSITMLRSSSMIRSSIAPSNTSIPTDASSLALSGAIAGVVVAIIIILVVIVATVILIALLVSRSKRQKLVINKGSTETSVTNPMMHIDELYDSIPNRQPSVVSTTKVHGTGDDTAIPTIIITKETLPNEASLSVPRITSSVSDYEVPIQTLTRAPPSTDYSPGSIYLQLENLEESDVLRGSSRSIYDELSQLPDDDKSTLRRDQVTTSIYDNSFDVDEKETLRRQLEDNYGNMDDDDNRSNNGDTLKRNKVYVEDEYDCIDVLDDLSLPPPINLDESSTAMGLTSEESAALQQDNGTPNAFYFSLEDPNEHQNEQKIETIEPVAEPVTQQKRTLKSTEKRKTKVFIQPAENEEEIYGQMETSSVTLISPKTLKFEGAIGSGQFGNVFKALWSKGGDRTIEVAVKTLQKNATEQEKIKFLQEAAIMAQFKHSNVIKLFGIVSRKDSPMIVIEYMPKGDLFGVLQKLRPDPGQLAHPDIRFNLLSFCRQVCLGMVYLSGKGFVHRDLAARNILVSADNICKIIDFGLSRDLEDENYYVSHKGAMIPVKWTAPEALNYHKYSSASDVWSYGCLMYEIWSVGHKPYEKFSNIDTLERICSGYRLPPPPGCPIAIYKLMMDCWHPIGDDRPSFNDIMLVLLQQDKDIFFMPEDALSTHPKSGTLGASLDAGELMYADIQKTYEGEMDTIL